MANEQNLIPNSERSPNEVRENGRKGGINSGRSRRKKADLRRIAQTVIDGTYHDKNGNEFTGEEVVLKGLLTNLTDPKGKNWGKAMDLLIQLTGANVTPEQAKKIKAEIKLAEAKAKQIVSDNSEIELVSDGFIEALDGTASEDWKNEEETDSGV